MRHPSADSHDGALFLPQEAALVSSSRQLAMWLFLATVVMLFAGLASALLVRRALPDWEAMPLPPLIAVNTCVLLLSSFSLEATRYRPRLGLVLTSLLGIGFLLLQWHLWKQLIAAGVSVPSSPHASFFYLLTGTHGAHLVCALMFVNLLTLRALLRPRRATEEGDLLLLGRMFWHFLTILWIGILALLVL